MSAFQEKYKEQLMYGINNDLIRPYNEEELELFRKVYYGGLPASILLLTVSLTNGFCYDRATLLAKCLIDTRDVNLIYGSVNSLRCNLDDNDDPMKADHCFVETIDDDGNHLIYDTSEGFVYDKDYYWLIEEPIIRMVNHRDDIIKFINEQDEIHPETEHDKMMGTLYLIPIIQSLYEKPNELYAQLGMLQEEVKTYKRV